MNNELMILDNNIQNLIYTIRDRQVMLDSDVAMLFEYKTKYINEKVRRNIKKFPINFYFELTKEELESLRSQIATTNKKLNSKNNLRGGSQYLPHVFTEQGIAMLAPLLENDIAVEVSINIMNAFVEMRKFINTNKNLFERVITIENKIDNKFIDYDNKFEQVFNALQTEEKFKQKIFFEGQIYDAYSLIIDIIKRANKKIVIIDNYVDDSILKMLTKKNRGVEVVILTSEKSNISKLDIQKFNKEYPVLKVANSDKFHDRFIIIDSIELYHCGASIKDLGKKCFGISKMENVEVLNVIKNIV